MRFFLLAFLLVLIVLVCNAEKNQDIRRKASGGACRHKAVGASCQALIMEGKGVCVGTQLKNGTQAMCCTLNPRCNGKGRKGLAEPDQVTKTRGGKIKGAQAIRPAKKGPLKKGPPGKIRGRGRDLLQKVKRKPAHLLKTMKDGKRRSKRNKAMALPTTA